MGLVPLMPFFILEYLKITLLLMQNDQRLSVASCEITSAFLSGCVFVVRVSWLKLRPSPLLTLRGTVWGRPHPPEPAL